jgi:hypothetical protein
VGNTHVRRGGEEEGEGGVYHAATRQNGQGEKGDQAQHVDGCVAYVRDVTGGEGKTGRQQQLRGVPQVPLQFSEP